MRKRKRGMVIGILLVACIVLIIVGFGILVAGEEKKEQKQVQPDFGTGVLDEIPDASDNAEYNGGAQREWTNTDDVVEGDAESGDFYEGVADGNDGEMQKLFQMGTLSETRSRLIMVVEEYNELIPYGYQGRSWSYGYFKQENGCENILYDSCANGLGLDGLGYVIWLYRNALGHTPEELTGNFSKARMNHEVSFSGLQVGDLCMTSDREEDVSYGVVCGFSPEGHVIVSMCDNIPCERFTYGCNHLAYIKSDYDEYLGNYAAVEFSRFYRLGEMMQEG